MSAGTSVTMFRQIAHVDEVMRTRGWNASIVEQIAKDLGVDRRTVYRIRARALRWTRGQLRPDDVENWRAQQVQALADTALEARQSGDYAAAAKCYDIQAKIVGTIAPTNVNVRHAVTVVDPRLAAEMSRKSVGELEGDVQKLVEMRQVIDVEPVGEPSRSTDG